MNILNKETKQINIYIMNPVAEFSRVYKILIDQDIKAGKKFLTSASDFLSRRVDIDTAIKAAKDILRTEYNIINL